MQKTRAKFEISDSVYLAGRFGMVGRAIERNLAANGVSCVGKSSHSLDLTARDQVFHEIETIRPEYLVIAAAKVGGILANSNEPVSFLSHNLQIQTNLMDAAHASGVKRILFLGSSCIYPRMSAQPIKEEELLNGPLESTNEAYAIAKIAGIKLVQAYRRQFGHHWISAMPTNLYGPFDNFDPESSHVIPGLIQRFDKAKSEDAPTVTIWGDGTPKREFMHVDDLAGACNLLLKVYDDPTPINVGTGEEITIKDLAVLIKEIVGFKGEIIFDWSKPNGTPRKILNTDKLAGIGWRNKIRLVEGIQETYFWYQENKSRG